ncbi:MAG: hypothetical protein LBN00_04870 [Oscillospiraceae bacterium]|jgi:hypothetical protein|nr:hypothetical protein [Oscillospiraceae bacterium]
MKKTTQIHNRFTGYTTEDCSCEYCRYYGGKRHGCKLSECCCLTEWLRSLPRGGGKPRPKEELPPWV